MFGSVFLRNFRCFDSERVVFKNGRGSVKDRIYLFGDNGSGKTSLLISLAFFRKLSDGYTINQIHNNRKTSKYEHKVPHFNLTDEVKANFRINAQAPMVLVYEIIVDGYTYIYELVFDNTYNLISESLVRTSSRRSVLVFCVSEDEVYLKSAISPSRNLDTLKMLVSKYKNQYTCLSLLLYSHRFSNGHLFHPRLTSLLNFIQDLHISITNYYNYNDFFNFMLDTDLHLTRGTVSQDFKHIFEKTTPILTEIISSIFPSIVQSRYKFEYIGDNSYSFYVEHLQQNPEGVYIIPEHALPSGLRHLTDNIIEFSNALSGSTLIIDDFEGVLHLYPFQFMIDHIISKIDGQVILSCNSNDILNLVDPHSIYLSQVIKLKHSVDCIETLSPSQPNHNIRNRYESGLYGTKPRTTSPNLSSEIEELRDLILNLKSTARSNLL